LPSVLERARTLLWTYHNDFTSCHGLPSGVCSYSPWTDTATIYIPNGAQNLPYVGEIDGAHLTSLAMAGGKAETAFVPLFAFADLIFPARLTPYTERGKAILMDRFTDDEMISFAALNCPIAHEISLHRHACLISASVRKCVTPLFLPYSVADGRRDILSFLTEKQLSLLERSAGESYGHFVSDWAFTLEAEAAMVDWTHLYYLFAKNPKYVAETQDDLIKFFHKQLALVASETNGRYSRRYRASLGTEQQNPELKNWRIANKILNWYSQGLAYGLGILSKFNFEGVFAATLIALNPVDSSTTGFERFKLISQIPRDEIPTDLNLESSVNTRIDEISSSKVEKTAKFMRDYWNWDDPEAAFRRTMRGLESRLCNEWNLNSKEYRETVANTIGPVKFSYDFSDLTGNYMPLMTVIEIEKPHRTVRYNEAVSRNRDFWKRLKADPMATTADISEYDEIMTRQIVSISNLVQREIDKEVWSSD
jgi:hypothetical protein